MDKIIGYTTKGERNTTRQLTGLELAKEDLANHFAIRKGEKWCNPDFGSNLPYLVFQPLDEITVGQIEDDVLAVVTYDPRFELMQNSTRVEEDAHYVTVRCELMYLPTTTPTDLVLKFDREFNNLSEF